LWNGRAAGDLRQLTDVRELELRDAARELGVAFLEIFDYPDGALEKVEEVEGVKERFLGDLVRCLRSHRPQVVVTFGPEGTYGHHRTQTQEWEPLRKFIEGQGEVEVFSLVGAAHGVAEDDLFTGVQI